MSKVIIILFLAFVLVSGGCSNSQDNTYNTNDRNSSIETKEHSVIDITKMIFVRSLNNGDTSNWNLTFITVDTNSLKVLKFPYVEKLTGNRFYSLNIINGSHYEYNLGKIPVILSYNPIDQSESLMLFPIDYCCSEGTIDFMAQFTGKDILKKDSITKEIASMLLTTRTRHEINCDKEYYELEYLINSNNDTLNVTISYKDKCFGWDVNINHKTDSTKLTIEEKTIFIFADNKIKIIDYSDWSR